MRHFLSVVDIRDTRYRPGSAPTIKSRKYRRPRPANLIKQRYAHIECEKNADFAYVNTEISYLLTLKNTGNTAAYILRSLISCRRLNCQKNRCHNLQ